MLEKDTQNWLCQVININDNSFTAKLTDLSNGGTYEEADFDLEDVSEPDLPLLKLGALFYWSVGYESDSNGQIREQSFIKFKRGLPFTEHEVNQIAYEAESLSKSLIWD